MEAVAEDAALGDRLRQRERLRDRRLAAVERGVEAGHLRQLRQPLEQHPDRRQVVRLVQRRERDVLFERREHRRIDAHRLGVLEAAVHDPMTDADEPVLGEPLTQERDEVIERAVMTERDALAPRLLVDGRAAAVLGNEARRRVQPLGLPARDEREALRAVGEQRELEARRARVQYGDRIGHVSARPPCGHLRDGLAGRFAPRVARPAPRCRRTRAASSPSRRGSSG